MTRDSVLNYEGATYIKFNWRNKLAGFRDVVKMNCCACYRKRMKFNHEDKLFIHGERHVKRDMNVFQIVQSIKKLKVAVSILLKDKDISTMHQIVQKYL